MKLSHLLIASAFVALSSISPAIAETGTAAHSVEPERGSKKLSARDRDFLLKAAENGTFEVKAGEVAAKKAVTPQVKAFGELMAKDHTGANAKLKDLAKQKALEIPDALSGEKANAVAQLEKLNGKEFDEQYIESMLNAHRKDVDDFTKRAEDGDDPQVKSFASSTLPTLENHLKQVEKLEDIFDDSEG